MSAACSGFIFALTTGASYIQSGMYKKVVVIGGDKMSAIMDYTDRTTCIIFGDGAGCVLLEPTTEDVGVIDYILKSDGTGESYLHMKAGGSRYPASDDTVNARHHFVYQEGAAVYKFAVTNMAEVSAQVAERNNLTPEDISLAGTPSGKQKNYRCNGSRVGITEDKVMMNIERYGNTTGGTIPLAAVGLRKETQKRRQPDHFCIWWWLYLGCRLC